MIDVNKELVSYRAYLKLKNFKPPTIQMYERILELFLTFCNSNYSGQTPNEEHAQNYLLNRIDAGKAWATINVDYSALRKYYKIVKDYPWTLKKLPRPKKDKKLPPILSKEEVGRLIEAAPNLKHRVFLTFLYTKGERLTRIMQWNFVMNVERPII